MRESRDRTGEMSAGVAAWPGKADRFRERHEPIHGGSGGDIQWTTTAWQVTSNTEAHILALPRVVRVVSRQSLNPAAGA